MSTLEEIANLDRRFFNDSKDPVFEGNEARFSKWQLENENVPKGMLDLFWPFFDKEAALSNLTPEDVKALMFELKIATLNFKMSHPDFEMTYEEVTNLDMMRPKAFLRAMRSTGGVGRERAIEATQIRQILTGEGTAPQGGIMSSIGAVLGGKKK